MNGRNRRRKDVPFNPFAPNAAAERNRRQAERAKEKRRQEAQTSNPTAISNSTSTSPVKSLDQRVKDAQKKLSVENPVDMHQEQVSESIEIEEEKVEDKPAKDEVFEASITETIEKPKPKAPTQSREDRLAELKRKSQESKNKAKLQTVQKVEEVSKTPVMELVSNPESIIEKGEVIDSSENSLNVFKTVKSTKKSTGISKKKRRPRHSDKKGGGRQRLEKKLNKQKILEFRYVARAILDNPDVPEEHRSNILGQMIAKGERISIESAIEFIEQKNLELILTDDIANQLKGEIKSISTRR